MAALKWLGLLYRRPRIFAAFLRNVSRHEPIETATILCLHALPWCILACVLGRLLIFSLVAVFVEGFQWESVVEAALDLGGITDGIAFGIACGIGFGIVFGTIGGSGFETTTGISGGIALGISNGVMFGLLNGTIIEVAIALLNGVEVSISDAPQIALVLRVVGGILFGAAGGIALGIAFGILNELATVTGTATLAILGIVGGVSVLTVPGFSSGLSGEVGGISLGVPFSAANGISVWLAFWVVRPRHYYLPFHLLFIWPRVRGRWYPFHPVAWDDICATWFPKFDRLLLAYAEHDLDAAEREVERLISDNRGRHSSALYPRTALLAREAGREENLARLSFIVDRLPEGETGFLAETRRIREMVNDISLLQTQLDTVDRPAFREPHAQVLRTAIEKFGYQVAGFHEPLVSEFRVASAQWLRIAERQLDNVRRVTLREPTPQVFRAGDPVNREQEAFVPRATVFGKLERQITLSTGCPGIVLCGRRRVGKSTILKNVTGFLPSSVAVATVSMQNPSAFTSLGAFLQLLAGEMRKAQPEVDVPQKVPRDLPEFYDFLAAWNENLVHNGKRLLLGVDEYENIDKKIAAGVFPEDLLATLRESIQSHRKLTWMFAGSHEISELTHAPWASYLVSARTVEVPFFTEAETRLLLTEPLNHSSLWDRDNLKRPRFDLTFWGDGGVQRIHVESAGWPHLVQLIAETAVDVLNDTDERRVSSGVLKRALEGAIEHGDIVLRQLMEGDSSLPGEWEYLCGFRMHDVQPPPEGEALRRSLLRRQVVVDDGGDWRLRVPLMKRWLRRRT